MRMSVLLAQESEDSVGLKPEIVTTTPVPPAKKKANRKQSRERQQFGSKDSVKVVNEIGGPRSLEVRAVQFYSVLLTNKLLYLS